ncbi:hypothetical protein V6N13_055601 [Hibiscus sabdariffa]|uniref:Uncharacterized protein n=2 Tax=Hibiscus sabdariffa TaxID=183260 RepID=A0ABR2BMC7_9ROSI
MKEISCPNSPPLPPAPDLPISSITAMDVGSTSTPLFFPTQIPSPMAFSGVGGPPPLVSATPPDAHCASALRRSLYENADSIY